jgi:hypothetical protein
MIFIGLAVSGKENINYKLDQYTSQLAEANESGDVQLAQLIESNISLLYGPHAIFSNASSVRALVWASFMTSFVAAALMIIQKILTLTEVMAVWVTGSKSLVLAVLVLIFAWAIGDVCKGIHTGDYVVYLVGDSAPPSLLSSVVFVISALISFATGTSWGTMAIVFPLAIPLAWAAAEGDRAILLGVISSVLAGSVFGDHCSPVSDTTILSASFSGCSLMNHVKTQIPYALTVGCASLVLGDLATGCSLYNEWVGLIFTISVCILIIYLFGKRVPDFEAKSDEASPCDRSSIAAGKGKEFDDEIVIEGKLSEDNIVDDTSQPSSSSYLESVADTAMAHHREQRSLEGGLLVGPLDKESWFASTILTMCRR